MEHDQCEFAIKPNLNETHRLWRVLKESKQTGGVSVENPKVGNKFVNWPSHFQSIYFMSMVVGNKLECFIALPPSPCQEKPRT